MNKNFKWWEAEAFAFLRLPKVLISSPIDIYFTAVDLFTVPQEQELLQMMEEIRKEKEISLKTA